MEERGVLLRGIARVLNAGGSALATVFDVTASTLGKALPGEKEKLRGKIRAYERKVERLYYEIGKEVSRQGDTTQISAAGEAGVRLVADYRAEIEIIKQRIEEIEAAERIERQHLLEEREAARSMKRQAAEKPVKMASEKTASYSEPCLPEAPVASEVSTAETEQERAANAEVSEPPIDELPKETSAAEAPVASEVSTVTAPEEVEEIVPETAATPEQELHKYTTEELQNMLKADLLALCTEKGIEADRRMTKAEIIELILGWYLE
jgi:hypothetical protein